MDRCAVFVDAGYLYAEGGRLCCGTRSRSAISLRPQPVIQILAEHAHRATNVPVLRTYWYDGARDGVRTTEQHAIARLPDVKLRLGRLVQGQQKGVDALIYRDLMTLAQQRAISDAVLLSGDEDLREGVRAAQDCGVRVVLVGIECPGGHNQSEELVLEADRHHVLTATDLKPMFSLRTAQPVDKKQAAAAAGETTNTVSQVAAQFTRRWLGDATETEVKELMAARPEIPRPLDTELLMTVEAELGTSLCDQENLRRRARQAFWGVVGGSFGRA